MRQTGSSARSPHGSGSPSEPFTHLGMLYRDADEYVHHVGAFIEEGVEAGEPVLVTAPSEAADALRERLGDAPGVEYADMRSTGGNPARVIPSVRAFVDRRPGQRARAVGQPTWPGLGPASLREVARMEALVNLAFTGTDATVLCAYAADGDADPALTHPEVLVRGDRGPSTGYSLDGLLVGGHPEPEPAPAYAVTMRVTSPYALGEVRAFVSRAAEAGEPDRSRTGAFEVAVSEATTNALVHGGGTALVAVWQDAREQTLVCEVRSAGRIADPLVGCVAPGSTGSGGRGMWLVNQLCDLSETHSGAWGTVIRMHLRSPASAAPAPTG